MIKTGKELACVQLKNNLQAELDKEYDGMSDEEIRRSMHEWLETSDDPLAQKWRRVKDFRPDKSEQSY